MEVKSFLRESMVNEFHTALGQYLDYETNIVFQEPDRQVFLAIPSSTFQKIQKTRAIMNAVNRFHLKLLIFDPDKSEIELWKKF